MIVTHTFLILACFICIGCFILGYLHAFRTLAFSVSNKELQILVLLLKQPKSYGLDLIAASNGDLKRGSIYVALSGLESLGLVESEAEKVGSIIPVRRKYNLTVRGREFLKLAFL